MRRRKRARAGAFSGDRHLPPGFRGKDPRPGASDADAGDADLEFRRAIREGRVQEVRAALADGIDPDGRGPSGDREPPILLAAAVPRSGARIAAALLENGADPDPREPGMQRAPVSVAARFGNAEAVEVLTRYGADPNARDRRDRTAMHEAARSGAPETVRALGRAGADPEARDRDGNPPLAFAAWRGHCESAGALLETGADPDARDRDGWTPLMNAARGRYPRTVAALLDAGADPDIRDRSGRDAASIAESVKAYGIRDLIEEQRRAEERDGVSDGADEAEFRPGA